jgi:hypothetical protein
LNYGIIILDHVFLLSYFALQVFSIETFTCLSQNNSSFWALGGRGEGPMGRAQNPSVPKLSIPKHPKEKKRKKGDT